MERDREARQKVTARDSRPQELKDYSAYRHRIDCEEINIRFMISIFT